MLALGALLAAVSAASQALASHSPMNHAAFGRAASAELCRSIVQRTSPKEPRFASVSRARLLLEQSNSFGIVAYDSLLDDAFALFVCHYAPEARHCVDAAVWPDGDVQRASHWRALRAWHAKHFCDTLVPGDLGARDLVAWHDET